MGKGIKAVIGLVCRLIAHYRCYAIRFIRVYTRGCIDMQKIYTLHKKIKSVKCFTLRYVFV